MRYRLLIVIGVLAVLVTPTVSAAAPIGSARSALFGSCPKARHEAAMRQTAASPPSFLVSWLGNCVGMGVRP